WVSRTCTSTWWRTASSPTRTHSRGRSSPRPARIEPRHGRRRPGGGRMADYETHEYDVLVIGAGGAGLRAAIEASARGLRTALVSKSLLGKAHTVMAEGGIAAAMGNV